MATSPPYTVLDIIKDAINEVGAISKAEPPDPDEQDLCLRALNIMLNGWSTERLMLRSYTSFSYPLTAGQFSYIIGPAVGYADWVGSKPIRILGGATIQDSSLNYYPCEQVEKAEWDSYEDRALTSSRPEKFCYDPGAAQQGGLGQVGVLNASTGTVYFYYTPDSTQTYTFNFEADCYLTGFTSVNQTVNFELAYMEALQWGLAVRIFRKFNEHAKEIPNDIVSRAAATHRRIKDMNARQVVAVTDLRSRGAVFNIYDNVWVGGSS